MIASLSGLRLRQYFMKHQQKSVNDQNNMRRLLVESLVFFSGLQRPTYTHQPLEVRWTSKQWRFLSQNSRGLAPRTNMKQ